LFEIGKQLKGVVVKAFFSAEEDLRLGMDKIGERGKDILRGILAYAILWIPLAVLFIIILFLATKV